MDHRPITTNNYKHMHLIISFQILFLILFGFFVRYSPDADARYHPISSNETEKELHDHHLKVGDGNVHVATYPFFQDVHVMIFIGFGFLMTFLKRYGFGAVGINFLVAATCLEWAILVLGFFHLHDGTIYIDLNSLLTADFTTAAVLISFGAVIGKTTPTQLLLMAIAEIPIFTLNEVVGRRYFGAVDMGDSMFVHAFGAYFGLAVSLMIHRRDVSTPKEGSSYRSDLFAMIGTIFLWLYWPSFNSGAAPGDDQHRAIINTYLSLCSCCLMAFAVSAMVHPEKKFDMVHIQNSTLAGGVAIGTAADLMIQPWGAILVGMVAGTLSVLGYTYLTPFLASKIRIHDTCGVNNLHGMPGILAGIIGIIMAATASESSYGASLYLIFPSRAPMENTEEFQKLQTLLPDLEPGYGISARTQAMYQFLALLVTFIIAIVGGIVTGFVLRFGIFQELETDDLYEDEKYWILEEGGEEESSSVMDGLPLSEKMSPVTRISETSHE